MEGLELLGMKVEDKVTGTRGVVTSICYDLFGCVQAVINQGIDKDGKALDSHWFDIERLEVTSKEPVMTVPNFGEVKGPAEKPLQ